MKEGGNKLRMSKVETFAFGKQISSSACLASNKQVFVVQANRILGHFICKFLPMYKHNHLQGLFISLRTILGWNLLPVTSLNKYYNRFL